MYYLKPYYILNIFKYIFKFKYINKFKINFQIKIYKNLYNINKLYKMSEIQDLNILLKPESNKNNKKIMEYLNNNQKKINNNDMLIKPLIIKADKIDNFIKLGVSNLPSLLHDGEIIYGVNEIIKYIDNLCIEKKNSNQKNNKIEQNDEDVRDYMLKTAMEKDDEQDSDIMSSKDLRNNKFTNHNKPKLSNNSNDKNDKIYDDDDDDIMAMYWDNTETTD